MTHHAQQNEILTCRTCNEYGLDRCYKNLIEGCFIVVTLDKIKGLFNAIYDPVALKFCIISREWSKWRLLLEFGGHNVPTFKVVSEERLHSKWLSIDRYRVNSSALLLSQSPQAQWAMTSFASFVPQHVKFFDWKYWTKKSWCNNAPHVQKRDLSRVNSIIRRPKEYRIGILIEHTWN